MALPARRLELQEDVPYEISYSGTVDPGSKVFAKCKIDGADSEIELHPSAGAYAATLQVPVGSEISGYLIQKKPGLPDKILGRIKKTTVTETGAAAPAAGPSASPAAPSASPATGPDARVKGYVTSLLEGLRSEKFSLENLEAILELLDQELEHASTDRTKTILFFINKILPEMGGISPELKEAFRGKPAPNDIEEVAVRMEEASKKFRHRVYLKLKADPESVKALNMQKGPFNYDNPFRDPRMNGIFDRVCLSYDLGGRKGAARCGVAVNFIPPAPPLQPELMKERRRALEQILRRRAGGRPGFLQKTTPSKADKILHCALHAGGIIALASGGIAAGIGLLAAKPVLEAITGLKVSDFMEAYQNPSSRRGIRELFGTLWKNSVLTDAFRPDKSLGEFAKDRLGYVLRGSVPIIGPLALSGETSVGGYEEEGAVVETAANKYKKVEDVIRKACETT